MIMSWTHPFPFRTRKLSNFMRTILGWRRPGKIRNADIRKKKRFILNRFFFMQIFSPGVRGTPLLIGGLAEKHGFLIDGEVYRITPFRPDTVSLKKGIACAIPFSYCSKSFSMI